MCTVKKYNMDLKRQFVSNHCVATFNKLIDMCLFSGEGKPTLLGGYVLTPEQAYSLGMGLVNTSSISDTATEEQKKAIINESILIAYRLVKDMNPEQAEKLKDLFDIKVIEPKPAKVAHGYIG